MRVTEGFGLAPRLIFHTVGPIWHGGQNGEADILANCYRNCLTELSNRGLRRIVFPAISTGAYGYPPSSGKSIAALHCPNLSWNGPHHFGVEGHEMDGPPLEMVRASRTGWAGLMG